MANQSANYIVIGSPATSVTVSPSVRQSSRPVLVTPLSCHGQPTRSTQPSQHSMAHISTVKAPIKKVMLKAVNRGSKRKEPKTFTLRDIRPEALTSCTAVKYLFKVQLSEDITEEDYVS